MRVTLVGVLVGMAGAGAANDPPHPRAKELQQLLVESCDWVLDAKVSGICLEANSWCPGHVSNNGSWVAKSCDDWGNYVTGNLARMLLATYKITGNSTYLAVGLAWADTLCAAQRNITSTAGSPAGFWPEEIYIADTGTAVTALAYAVHLADTPWRKQRYQDVLQRYASWVLEGCAAPPGNTSTGKWSRVIGKEPHPYSWVIPAGPDKGSMGDGYWNGTLNDAPYTIATATTGAAFFAELYGLTGNITFRDVAVNAVGWLVKYRAANGANVYRFDHPGPYPEPYVGADILTETTTYPSEGFLSLDRHVPGALPQLQPLNTTVEWVLSMQATNGSLGIPMTPGGERATRIASLLQWAQLRLDPATSTAAARGVDAWVDYILSEKGAWETGVRVYGLPTSFVGLALADLVEPWVTWSPQNASQR